MTLHQRCLGFNLTYMNITDYQFMQSLNVTKFTMKQLGQLTHKLCNYTMVNYDSSREYISQINENYPYSMPIWIMILITGLGTLIKGVRISSLLY